MVAESVQAGGPAALPMGERTRAEEDPNPEFVAPSERFMSHSLRIGGASALFQGTGEIELVKRTGRRTSSAVQRHCMMASRL